MTRLQNTSSGFYAIWVIMDRMTKSVHFNLINISFSFQKLAETNIVAIVKLHGIPLSVVSDRDPRLASRFWESL